MRLALAFGALLALAALNIAAFQWGARQRQHVFGEFREAITRHGALTEAQVSLEDHAKRVKVVSDLLGVEQAPLEPEEHARLLQSLAAIRRRLAPEVLVDADDGPEPQLLLVSARTDSLVHSWRTFYGRQRTDPERAIAELVLTAEPLAQRLLGVDLPAAVAAQSRRVTLASAAFVRTDRTSSRFVWAILIVSGLCSAGLFYSLSRDLLRAIGALKRGVERFGAGELAYRVVVRHCDELTEVGESLNTMAGRLLQVREELELRNQELASLAFRDTLTKLANRALFREHVERALSGSDRRPEDVAVLFIDLDNFKAVNDTLGHEIGDRLLVRVAERLLSTTRGSDVVARLGGDEFAVLLDRVRSPAEAVLVAERITTAMQPPFALGGRAMHVGASVGVACGRDGESIDELLRNADLAMYRAKAAGKNRHALFAPEMHAALLDRVELEDELRHGLERDEFSLVYQPVVELSDRRVVGFEALVRWQHPRRGPVPPSLFIPMAEESGTIQALGRWVLAQACREAASWRALVGESEPPGVSVNVSGRQLDDASFVHEVRDVLATTGLCPRRLTLEITETAIMRDSAATLTRLRELKALGVRLAIDDFGTGYSSLAYLQRFPVDILKVDKAFVDQVARGGNDAALARTIIALGDMLGLRTVAEGIEHAEQHEGLRALGCTLGQGYYFSRPLSVAAARALLAERAAPEGILEAAAA